MLLASSPTADGDHYNQNETNAIIDASTSTLLASKRRELLWLDTQKKALESEAEAIVIELTAELPGGVR